METSQNIKPLNLRPSYIYLWFNKYSILKSMHLWVKGLLFLDWSKVMLFLCLLMNYIAPEID